MKKRILLSLALVAAVAVGAMGLVAYEAHIINVTAHIENALYVHPDSIAFGTVFPQEYVERQVTIEMSDSFRSEDRVDDIEYVIKQKPKCECIYDEVDDPDEFDRYCTKGQYAPVNYATHKCPDLMDDAGNTLYVAMQSLCTYLSKVDADPDDNNDTSHPSYYVPEKVDGSTTTPAHCIKPGPDATGRLSKIENDLLDLWTIDLKAPPFDGYVGQDWPAGCPVLGGDPDGQDFGCDLWIEITEISPTPNG